MGLFWRSANGNNGIGLSTPTPPSRAWRPSEESVAMVAAVIGNPPSAIGSLVLKRRDCATGRIKAGEGALRV